MTYSLTIVTQALTVALAVVIVTHEYLLLTVIVCWAPGVFDTVIPYILGFGEIWLSLATGHIISWWIALSSLCLGGILSFWHTMARATKGVFGDKEESYRQYRTSLRAQIFLCLIVLVSGSAGVFLNAYHACPALLNIALMWGVIIIAAAIATLRERNQHKIYDEYEIPRLTFRGRRSP